MNPRRGCNPKLEESYLLYYSDSEAENITKGTLVLHLRLVKVSAPDRFPIWRCSESPNMTSFLSSRVFKHETLIFSSYNCSSVSDTRQIISGYI